MTMGDGGRKKRKTHDAIDSNESTLVDLQGAAAYSFVIKDLQSRGLPNLASALVRENPHTKQDPVAVLGKDLCHHIFSFLCEKPETFGEEDGIHCRRWLCGIAGKLYSQLRSVSPVWKATFDGIAWADWVGTVAVELESVDSKQSLSYIDWLCRYKVQLGHVVIKRSMDPKKLPFFTKLITECQTKGLSGLHFRTRGLHKIHQTAEKNLHDMIAQQCPNLTTLETSLSLPKNTPVYKDYISKALFSIPSITGLHISIDFCDAIGPAVVDPKWGTKTPIEGLVITSLIQNLPNLHALVIRSFKNRRELHCKNQLFHIESKTLEHLGVEKFFKGAVLSLDCPALVECDCDGGPNGNGCLPNNQLSEGTYQSIFANAWFGQEGTEPLAPAAERPWMASPLLQVSNGCTFFLHDFHKWGERSNGYDELMQRSNEFANAAYQTFGED